MAGLSSMYAPKGGRASIHAAASFVYVFEYTYARLIRMTSLSRLQRIIVIIYAIEPDDESHYA